MANYNTNLKDWGSSGTEPPDGYKYVKDKSPVDAFDNWKSHNLIEDVQHLVSLTNDRVESDTGTTRPSSPESAHIFADTDSGDLEWYDSGSATWRRALDATGDSMSGDLDLDGQLLTDSTGSITLDGDANVSSGQLNEQGNRVATRTWANSNFNDYADSEARSAVESGDVSYVSFANIETVAKGQLGRDDSMGFIGKWGSSNNMAVLWDSNNVTAGTNINISGGTGDESFPTISHADSSNQGDVTTGGATIIDDIYIDGNGHITDLNTENRSLDDWTNANSSINIGGNDIHNVRQIDGDSGDHRIRFDSSKGWVEFTDQSNNRDMIVTRDCYIDQRKSWIGDDGVFAPSENGYEIRKNGGDGNGIINFKT